MTASVYTTIFVAGFLATQCWRLLAIYLASKINPDGPMLQWVRAVATALVAALVTRLVIDPVGLLAATNDFARPLAIIVGFAVVFLVPKYKTELAVVAACAIVLLGFWVE